MKRFLLLAFWLSLATFFAMPIALGIFDAWCYIVFGATVTGVQWTPDTMWLAWAMMFPSLGCWFAGFVVAGD